MGGKNPTKYGLNGESKKPKVGTLKSGIRANMGPALGNLISRVSDALISGRGPFHNTGYFQPDSYYTWTNQNGSAGPGREILKNTILFETSLVLMGTTTGWYTGAVNGSGLLSSINGATGNKLGISDKFQAWFDLFQIINSVPAFVQSGGMYKNVYQLNISINSTISAIELKWKEFFPEK